MDTSNIFYSVIGILAIVIHIIINHKYYLYNDTRQEIKEYKKYLSIIFLYFLTDAAWGVFNGARLIQALYIDTILYYITMAFSVVFCCRYVISFLKLNNIVGRMLNRFGLIFGFGEIIVLIINHFYHIFFWFDEDGTYQAYAFRHFALVTQVLMFGFISLMSLYVALKKTDTVRSRNITICLFGFSMTMALIAQSLFPLLPLYTIGLMLGTLIIHVFIHNDEQNTQLTKIEELNDKLTEERKSLETQKDELATALGIIRGLSHDFYSIWLVDKDTGKIQMVRSPGIGSMGAAVQIGLDNEDGNVAVQKYIEAYVSPEDQPRLYEQLRVDKVFEHLNNSDFYAINYMRRRDDGDVDYNQIAFANADTADGKRQIVFGFRNINDILKQEQDLRKEINDAKVAAEAANAAKTSFLFNMSHDIRTPMNAIIGFRDLLEKNQEDAEKRADYLKKIEESSNVLLSIINNVLEMARIEKGVLDIEESPWSAEQMSDMMYSVFIDMMKQKGLEFTREIDVQHHYMFCDALKTREVIINILSNAYKYTKSGGKVHMQLKEIPCEKEGYARYRTTISDTGIGMSEEFIPHIFEEFSREYNSTHSKIEGTGLGMPIVKRLVDLMGGTIEVKSEKGVGTTFIVTLDHRIANKSMLSEVESAPETAPLEGKRILLAEDNELNAEIAIAVLSEVGLTVDRATDGQECIDMLLKANDGYYDLILMDIQMPRMNGYEATRAIRALDDKNKSQIKIIAMTANAFEEDKREAMKAGMNAHLAKPINISELTKALTTSLA